MYFGAGAEIKVTTLDSLGGESAGSDNRTQSGQSCTWQNLSRAILETVMTVIVYLNILVPKRVLTSSQTNCHTTVPPRVFGHSPRDP